MQLRILRKTTMRNHPVTQDAIAEHYDRLQILAPILDHGYGSGMDWFDVPIVLDEPSNKSENGK